MRRTLFAVLLALAIPAAVPATSPPDLINYQGVLRDENGEPLSGDFDMVFSLWLTPTGGNDVIRDEHLASGTGPVNVSGGLFSVQIGSGQLVDGSEAQTYTTLSQAFRTFTELYLEVQVEGESLIPRTRVAAAPYAMSGAQIYGVEAVIPVSTGSVTFIDLPGMTATIDTVGGPVLILFSATWTPQTVGTGAIFIVNIDGVDEAATLTSESGAGAGLPQALAITHVKALPPGSHTFKVRYRNTGAPPFTVTTRRLQILEH